MPERIAIYNENCVMAGKAVPMSRLDDNPDSWDWTWYDVTEEEAEFHETRGPFGRKVAATVREVLYRWTGKHTNGGTLRW